MFNCPNCNADTAKLVADGRQNPNGTWLKCPACSCKRDDAYVGIMHQSAGNKHAPNMTEIEKRHLECRVPGPDNMVRYTDPRLRTNSHR